MHTKSGCYIIDLVKHYSTVEHSKTLFRIINYCSGDYRDSRALMVEDSDYIHPARGDYNTEALIVRVAAARFLDVFKEEISKMKENVVALIIT